MLQKAADTIATICFHFLRTSFIHFLSLDVMNKVCGKFAKKI
jgi:hypothetical protein